MRRLRARCVLGAALVVSAISSTRSVDAQLPLSPLKASGQDGHAGLRGLVQESGRDVQHLVRLLQPQLRRGARDPDRPGQLHRRRGTANQGQPTHFEPRRHWGVFAVQGARRLRRQEGRLDGQDSRPDVGDSRQPASELADRRARGRSRLRATRRRVLKFDRRRAGRRWPGRNHRRAAVTRRVGKPIAAQRLGARTTARPSSSIARDGRAGANGHPHVVQASGPGNGHVCARRRRVPRDRWSGDDDRHVQRAGRVHPSCSRQRRLGHRRRRARAVLLVEWVREGHGQPARNEERIDERSMTDAVLATHRDRRRLCCSRMASVASDAAGAERDERARPGARPPPRRRATSR